MDRIGGIRGYYASPYIGGVPQTEASRALEKTLNEAKQGGFWRIELQDGKELTVFEGEVIPWYGKSGGGTQWYSEISFEKLDDAKIIKYTEIK